MKILAIETSTPASSVAIGEDSNLVAMALKVDAKGHVGFLVSAIDYCFSQAGWKPTDIDVVVVDIGPGPFTGLRAGVSTAQAVAAAVGAHVVTVGSLTTLALRAATGRRRIWPIVDVRRGEVATAPYRPVPGGVVRDGPTELVKVEDFGNLLSADAEDTLVVGDVPALPDGIIRGLSRVKIGRPRYPAADVLLEIGYLKARQEEFASTEEVRPLYLREPDAQINWREFREEGLWPS